MLGPATATSFQPPTLSQLPALWAIRSGPVPNSLTPATAPCPGLASGSLGQETPALAALVGLTALQEEQLGPVQDVHQHRQLRLYQGPQPLLQGCDNVLGWLQKSHYRARCGPPGPKR